MSTPVKHCNWITYPQRPKWSHGIALFSCVILFLELRVGNPLAAPSTLETWLLGNGVTSLHQVSKGQESCFIFAGTKRGAVQQYVLSDLTLTPVGEIQDSSSRTLPVYSIDTKSHTSKGSLGDTLQLFCGGGNRFISIWDHDKKGKFKLSQNLGPHTGWVKDVVYDNRNDVIHSIGCNCIESWETTDKNGNELSWCHSTKRSISSSPNEGATLSSDLLCLCTDQAEDCLYAGGVDGRIHCWSSDISIASPLESIGAHDGRVNELVLAPKARMLFSVGHDGILQCRLLQRDGKYLSAKPAGTIGIVGESDNCLRITSIVCVNDADTVSAEVVLGASNGFLRRVSARKQDEKAVVLSTVGSQVILEGEPMVHDLCSTTPNTLIKGGGLRLVVAGHANGLSLVSI